LITAKFSLIIYSPLTSPGNPNTLSQDTRDRLFMASIEIIEYSRVLQDESSTKQWGWLFSTYFQWHAIAYILGELCTRPNSTIVERAWRTIDTVFKDWDSANAHGKSGMLWKPLKKLMTRAQAHKARQDRAANNTGNNIGMDESLITPSPSGYPSTMPPRDRLMPQLTDTTKDPAGELGFSAGFPFQLQADAAMAESVGIGMLAHGQIQQQFQQQATHEQRWLTDDGALADLDMAEGDVNWEGWDDLVKEFSTETQPLDQRGPALGSMGTWW